ncbi:MAG TPA: nitroreductase family deazaflavin-dependent oxidoreductase [Blastocatellia bacterium]|nr:nitroreductase family deazaflavin-dependent oxidoreductase [Blastocatellia bacterium]
MRVEELARCRDLDVLDLITTGRITGVLRNTELWFVYDAGNLYVLAEHSYATQWVKNIIRESRVRVKLGQLEFRGVARVLDPERDNQAWNRVQQLAVEKYGWGDGLPVEITPN